MTMDRTLRTHGGLARQRSVLRRDERIERLTEDGQFDPDADSPLGLPKTKVHHSKAGTKIKKAEEKPAETTEAAEPALAEGAAEEGK